MVTFNKQYKLVPFRVPNYVLVAGQDDMKFPLEQLNAKTADELCKLFRKAVMDKVNAPQPPERAEDE